MEIVADFLAKYVLSKKTDLEYDYEILKYGFQVGLELTICSVVSISAAIYMDMMLEFLILLGTFIILRSYGGGIHLDSFISCFICSCAVIIGMLVYAKHYEIQESIAWTIILLGLLSIFLFGPIESQKKPLDSIEKEVFTKRLRVALIQVLVISALFKVIGQKAYVSLVALAVLVVTTSMVIGKIRNKSSRR